MSDLQEIVKSKYGAVAVSGLTNADAGVQAVAEAFGYSAAELASIPAEANMGLSCGNPIATAAGLAAAIPAVVAYNYYLHRLRRLEGEIDIFVEELLAVFRSSVPSEAPRVGGRAPLQR